jgi:hypothetical protein
MWRKETIQKEERKKKQSHTKIISNFLDIEFLRYRRQSCVYEAGAGCNEKLTLREIRKFWEKI